MRTLSEYVQILKKKGIYTCLKETKKKLWPIWLTHNRFTIDQIEAERTERYLWRRYKDLIVSPLKKHNIGTTIPKIIWICWLQGYENAPDIVKVCRKSVEYWAKDFEIRIVTAENMLKWVTLPNHIINKYLSNKMSFTHLSDVLRTCLLVEHGGIWMDATVLLTGPIPKYITDEPLFFFQKSILASIPHFGSNWFLASVPNHPILIRQKELLSAYWERELVLKDYFIYHVFLYLLLNRNIEAKRYKLNIPYVPNVDVHTLQFSLFNIYEDKQWNNIIQRSSIHKLTWKIKDPQKLADKTNIYNHILCLQ